jgi:hypothetical protein
MLPSSWVEEIFARLLVRYGAAWLRMWEGVDIEAVKADWANELSGFAQWPQAIKHGLSHLPVDKPPGVSEFKRLCQGAPIGIPLQLPAPKADPQRVAHVMQQVNRRQASDHKQWALRLQEREQRGERLTPTQRQAWRAALMPRSTFTEFA